MKISEVEKDAAVEARTIREWAKERLVPEAHKEKASKGERKDYDFREGSVDRVIAIASLLWDVSFSRDELRSIFRAEVPLDVLSEKLRTLPFHRFLDFLRSQGAELDDTQHLDRFIGVGKRGKK
jgi:DNA-binding transcriptional MerR regulator